MKKIKLLSSILAILMLLSTLGATVVSASEVTAISTSSSFIIENDFNSTGISIKDKTYNLYQVFSAKVTETAGENTDDSIEYFVNPEFYDFFLDKAGITYPVDNGDAVEYQEAVDAYNHAATDYINKFTTTAEKQSVVTDLREYIVTNSKTADYVADNYTKVGTSGEKITVDGVELGYYVIFDSKALVPSGSSTETVTNGSLTTIPGRAEDGSLTANVTVTLKGTAPKIDKEIWHNDLKNDKVDNSLIHGDKGSWDDVADYQIGDVVEFRLTVDVPADVSAYDKYVFTITDTLSEGLEFNDDIEIYEDADLNSDPVPGALHDTSYGKLNGEDYTFKMDFDMIAIKNGYKSLERFYVYYTATVTKDAKVFEDFENNKVELIFSNNPYDDKSFGSSKDDVYGYTFQLEVFKTKGDGVTALKDAVFGLYEVEFSDNGAIETQIYLELNTNAELEVPTYYPTKAVASDTTGVITTDGTGRFNIAGLDDAKSYVLKEIKAPTDYNAADPIRFEISANYAKDEATGIPTPTITVTGDTDGLDLKVINTSAKLLPETGGIGTTIFTISGVIIMLGAAVILLVKSRKKSATK